MSSHSSTKAPTTSVGQADRSSCRIRRALRRAGTKKSTTPRRDSWLQRNHGRLRARDRSAQLVRSGERLGITVGADTHSTLTGIALPTEPTSPSCAVPLGATLRRRLYLASVAAVTAVTAVAETEVAVAAEPRGARLPDAGFWTQICSALSSQGPRAANLYCVDSLEAKAGFEADPPRRLSRQAAPAMCTKDSAVPAFSTVSCAAHP